MSAAEEAGAAAAAAPATRKRSFITFDQPYVDYVRGAVFGDSAVLYLGPDVCMQVREAADLRQLEKVAGELAGKLEKLQADQVSEVERLRVRVAELESRVGDPASIGVQAAAEQPHQGFASGCTHTDARLDWWYASALAVETVSIILLEAGLSLSELEISQHVDGVSVIVAGPAREKAFHLLLARDLRCAPYKGYDIWSPADVPDAGRRAPGPAATAIGDPR